MSYDMLIEQIRTLPDKKGTSFADYYIPNMWYVQSPPGRK